MRTQKNKEKFGEEELSLKEEEIAAIPQHKIKVRTPVLREEANELM